MKKELKSAIENKNNPSLELAVMFTKEMENPKNKEKYLELLKATEEQIKKAKNITQKSLLVFEIF